MALYAQLWFRLMSSRGNVSLKFHAGLQHTTVFYQNLYERYRFILIY